jgi:hypothetical protein
MRRIRQEISSEAIPFEDKASSMNRKHEENSDGDSVRNSSAIFSSRLHRPVQDVNAQQGNRLLISVDAPADIDKRAKTMYVVTIRCK